MISTSCMAYSFEPTSNSLHQHSFIFHPYYLFKQSCLYILILRSVEDTPSFLLYIITPNCIQSRISAIRSDESYFCSFSFFIRVRVYVKRNKSLFSKVQEHFSDFISSSLGGKNIFLSKTIISFPRCLSPSGTEH
jgi:hypothetical protein